MELMHRYLSAVGQRLPESEREDVLTELEAAIRSEYEARLVHPSEHTEALTEVLKGFGPPEQIAAAYGSQRALIGPVLYPDFLKALRSILLLAALLLTAVCLFQGRFEDVQFGPLQLFALYLEAAIWISVAVTLTFAALERAKSSNDTAAFDPAQLPELQGPVSNGDLVTNFVTELIFLIWWNDVLRFQDWLPSSIAEHYPLALGDSWAPWFWPFNLIFVASLLLHGAVLWQQCWQRWQLALEFMLNGLLFGAGLMLLLNGELVSLSAPSERADSFETIARATITVVMVLTAWDFWQALRIWRRTGWRFAASG